jgi:hypothetical protein
MLNTGLPENHYRSSSLIWNPKIITKKSTSYNSCKTAKSELSHQDSKELLHNVHGDKVTGTQKPTA